MPFLARLLALLLVPFSAHAQAPPRYDLERLLLSPRSAALGLNEAGDVVGWVEDTEQLSLSALISFHDERHAPLVLPNVSVFTDINEARWCVGASLDGWPTDAFVEDATPVLGEAVAYHPDSGRWPIDFSDTGFIAEHSSAYGVNDAIPPMVTGIADIGECRLAFVATVEPNATPTLLLPWWDSDASEGLAVSTPNAATGLGRQVVGTSRPCGITHAACEGIAAPTDLGLSATRWDVDGSPKGLDRRASVQRRGSVGRDIASSTGWICGSRMTAAGCLSEAVIWKAGVVEVLPTPPGMAVTRARAVAMNESGAAVGWMQETPKGPKHPTVWLADPRRVFLLDPLVVQPGWTLVEVTDINDRGQICGSARRGSLHQNAVVLNPPPPIGPPA
ncbi:MAG: hypothetical protein AAF533_27835 [Acidobacteriota bacterium]